MMKYILITLLGLTLLSFNSANAEHYNEFFEVHEQCVENCEDERDRALEELSCDYYATQSVYQRCDNAASSARSSCYSECSNGESEAIQSCNQEFRDDKKDCRENKREETKECRDAKKVEKASCRQNKIDEKEACKSLSGQAKRDCKKQARKNKRECKKQARITKRACKKEAREDKRECKDDTKEERDNCITSAEDAGNVCRNKCNDTYEATCVEEREAANACAILARPIFNTESICKEVCDDEKEEGLEGYNAQCPNDHAGDKGATITFVNVSGETRYIYKSRTDTSGLMIEDGSVSDDGTYVQEIACGVRQTFHFKRTQTENSIFVGQTFILGPYPCCEEKTEQTVAINPNGS